MPRPRRTVKRRVGAWSAAIVVWETWRRIPRRHRKLILWHARKHGPRLARQALARRRRTRR